MPPYTDNPPRRPGSSRDDDKSTGSPSRRMSQSSESSVSTTSIVFDRIDERVSAEKAAAALKKDKEQPYDNDYDVNDDDLETGPFLGNGRDGQHGKPREREMDRGMRRILLIVAGLLVAAWLGGLVVYVSTKSYQHPSKVEHDPAATGAHRGSGKAITMDQVMGSFWRPESHSIRWVAGPNGEDGLLLEKGAPGKPFVVVEDIRSKTGKPTRDEVPGPRTLIESGWFDYGGKTYMADMIEPSKDLQRVLIATDVQRNWRHSYFAAYWIFDVKTQKAEPLVPGEPGARIQLAKWSPTGDAVVYTRENNMYLRHVGSIKVTQITTDGSPEVFNGVPDWVYEEEVFSGSSATWWSDDGKYIAFLRTNETGVPEYPVQYFLSRPSGEQPKPGEENYPETLWIKYPKAGAHNPIVELLFYDVSRGEVFPVDIPDRFPDDDRLITEVVWAGDKVLVKETNRVSDIMHLNLIDPVARTGKRVRVLDVKALDGGWFEITHQTKYIPSDPAKGRPHDGYIDLMVNGDADHLHYFTPLDNPEPITLTSGDWEVVDSEYAVDLERNIVYFVATKESSIERHVYQVSLTGEGLAPVTDTSKEGYYSASFSTGAGYLLLSYQGPRIPWQKVISTPSNPKKYEYIVEENKELAENAKKYELPIKIYGTIEVDGVKLNYVERRPPHFDENKKYPVLFYQYSGPGSQMVKKKWDVDWQSYVAAGLGYIVVTVDGRGTGYIGRKNRIITRGKLGHWESHDQIAAGKIWAKKKYVDETRMAIWGWSFGGFNTLKTLEQDAGQTFRYGMAVAPVTDWRFYDSIYTERYMLTPQENGHGYDVSAITNVTALAQNVRFLIMHGVADDNVHFQNSLTLLDRLDLVGVENYDVHVFPDSDHGIYFHNANRIVYDSKWLSWRKFGGNGR